MKIKNFPKIIILASLIVISVSIVKNVATSKEAGIFGINFRYLLASATLLSPHQTTVYISPNPALVNQMVTIKTDSIPECNSSTASCEWRWSGSVLKTTTNKLTGQWTTSFSTTGTKNISVEVYVKDATICDNTWIKVAYGSVTFTVTSATPTSTSTSTPTPTPIPTPTSIPNSTPTPTLTSIPTPTCTTTSTPIPTPTPTSNPTCSFVPHKTQIYFSSNPALKNQDVSIKTALIPECNSPSAACEWRWSGNVNGINNNKPFGEWTTKFNNTGTKEIKVEVYVKDSTICGDDWIKVAYASDNLEIVSGGVNPTSTPTPTSTESPSTTPTPTSVSYSSGGGGYWIGGTPTPTVLGTTTCAFTHFNSALAEKTCWINGKNGGACTVTTNDGFSVRLAVISGSYYEDIRINMAVLNLSDLINSNFQIGNYSFVGNKIIHIAAENENCQSIDLENLAVLSINYFDQDITSKDENSLTIVQGKYYPSSLVFKNTIRNNILNNLSTFTADFGYFGIVGLPMKKVLGVATVATPTPIPSPKFISWFDPVCTNENKDFSKYFALINLWNKIKNFHLSWYMLSLIFNLLLLLWLFWVYVGKKLLEKYHNIANNKTVNDEMSTASNNISQANDVSQSQVIDLPPYQPKVQPSAIVTLENNQNKENDEEILHQLKEKLNQDF